MEQLWLDLNTLLDNFFPTDFTLFQRLLVIGTCFGVVVWVINKLKGD